LLVWLLGCHTQSVPQTGRVDHPLACVYQTSLGTVADEEPLQINRKVKLLVAPESIFVLLLYALLPEFLFGDDPRALSNGDELVGCHIGYGLNRARRPSDN